MRCGIGIILACLGLAPPALAGPWLRNVDDRFVALSYTPRDDATQETGIYAELGAAPNLTVGIDANYTVETGHALAFARVPLRRGDWVAAVDLGLGVHMYPGVSGPMARLLFGVGRPLEWRGRTGWAAVAIGPEWRSGAGGVAWKTDAVAGFNGPAAINPVVSLETYLAASGDLYWTLVPGLTYRDRSDRTWLLAYERKGGADRAHGIRFALWLQF